MNDLISRAAAKQSINNYKNSMIGLGPLEINRVVDIFQIIQKLPAVDAVPVVRCRDCKYWYAEIGASTGWLPCQEIVTDSNWFCASGKRRDDDA